MDKLKHVLQLPTCRAALAGGILAVPSMRPHAAQEGTPSMETASAGTIHFADNLDVLRCLPAGSIDLIYIDPPFNTGKVQQRTQLHTVRAEHPDDGDRTGFQGRRYASLVIGTQRFDDLFDDYLAALEPRLVEAHRVLAPHGSLYLHLDPREVHYAKVLLDLIFGRACFLNEIIWAYDYGGKPKRRWPPKHDNILLYAKHPRDYVFNVDAVDRIPYMAPDLVTAEKAARGKLPTDTWWHTIVPTRGREKTGYPTQKPLGILRRIVAASSPPGGTVLDFYAGSGTTGAAALELGRRFVLVDNNPAALETMARRFAGVAGIQWRDFDPTPPRPGAALP
jgi:site-specific DNA-methyltransferase (adenine-specific)